MRTMRTVGVLVLLAGLAMGASVAVWAAGAAAAPAGVKVGDKPVINWKTTDGKAVTNAVLKGRIVIVDFWATWCGPCMAEAPHMVKISKDYADKGVSILGVSLDMDPAAIPPVAKAKGFTWPQVCDGKMWQASQAVAWGVDSIPRTFILSPDGEVVWTGHPGNIDAPLAAAVAKYADQIAVTKKEASAATEPAAVVAEPVAPVVPPATAPATAPTVAKGPSAALVEARLAAADKDRAAKRDIDAYGKYKWIVENAPGTPAADAAAPRVKEYEADAKFMAAVAAAAKERDAASDLWMAKSLIKAGKVEEGQKILAELVKKYPDTAAGKEAATLVDTGP